MLRDALPGKTGIGNPTTPHGLAHLSNQTGLFFRPDLARWSNASGFSVKYLCSLFYILSLSFKEYQSKGKGVNEFEVGRQLPEYHYCHSPPAHMSRRLRRPRSQLVLVGSVVPNYLVKLSKLHGFLGDIGLCMNGLLAEQFKLLILLPFWRLCFSTRLSLRFCWDKLWPSRDTQDTVAQLYSTMYVFYR
jgi:hypothetical protein